MKKSIAQRMGFFNKLREKVNLRGRAAEWWTESFSLFMNEVRKTDDEVRDLAEKLDEYLKQSKQLFSDREYISFFGPLNSFYHIHKSIVIKLEKIDNDFTSGTYKFLASSLKKEHADELKNIHIDASKIEVLIKQAAFFDWFNSLFDTRKMGLRSLQKRFPKFFAELKKEGRKLLDLAIILQKTLLSNLKSMAKARATRKIEIYVLSIRSYVSKFDVFESYFKTFDKKHVQNAVKELPEEIKSRHTQTETKTPESVTSKPNTSSENVTKPSSSTTAELSNEEIQDLINKSNKFTKQVEPVEAPAVTEVSTKDIAKEQRIQELKKQREEEAAAREAAIIAEDEAFINTPAKQKTPQQPAQAPAVATKPEEDLEEMARIKARQKRLEIARGPAQPLYTPQQPKPQSRVDELQKLLRETDPGNVSLDVPNKNKK